MLDNDFIIAVIVSPTTFFFDLDTDMELISQAFNVVNVALGWETQPLEWLDTVQSHGLSVILNLTPTWWWNREEIIAFWHNQAQLGESHPAVIGFLLKFDLTCRGSYWEPYPFASCFDYLLCSSIVREHSNKPISLGTFPCWSPNYPQYYTPDCDGLRDEKFNQLMPYIDWLLVQDPRKDVIFDGIKRFGNTTLFSQYCAFRGPTYLQAGMTSAMVKEYTDTAWNILHAGGKGVFYYVWQGSYAEDHYRMLNIDGSTNPLYDAFVENFQALKEYEPRPCAIATATYGTPLAPQLNVLRQFRNHCLPNALTQLYYSTSPPIAEYIRRHSNVRRITRQLLEPLIKTIRRLL